MAEEKKFYKTHFTVPELPWKKGENKVDEPIKEEKIFMVSIHWGMGNFDRYLMKAIDKNDAEEKAKRVFAGNKYFSVFSLDELEFDKDGVHYL